MQRKILLLPAALVFALAGAGSALGGAADQKMVIRLQADDFELAETDISHLEVGEAETVVTDSGKTIDLLRTAEGVEVYVDGELLDLGMPDEDSGHGEHGATHQRVKVICSDDDHCEKHVVVGDAADIDLHGLHAGDGEHLIIRKRIEIECDAAEECEEVEIESLDELGDAHRVIMLRADGDHEVEIIGDEVEVIHGEDGHRKVYVIKKEG